MTTLANKIYVSMGSRTAGENFLSELSLKSSIKWRGSTSCLKDYFSFISKAIHEDQLILYCFCCDFREKSLTWTEEEYYLKEDGWIEVTNQEFINRCKIEIPIK